MKKLFLVTIIAFITVGIANAQYNFAIGLRSGGTSGLTLKKNNGPSAIEGIIGFWHNGLTLTALWEQNREAFNTSGLNWYYGVGGHVASYGDDFDRHGGPSWYNHPYAVDKSTFGIGVDGIVGMEYKISNVPIALSIDFKPYIEILGDGDVFFSPDPGIGIKVAF